MTTMNIKSIKDELKSKRQELNRLRCSVETDPAVAKAYKEYHDAKTKVHIATQEKVDILYKEIKEIDRRLTNALMEKEQEIPQDIQDKVKHFHSGCDWGTHGLKVKWISDNKRFIIITNGGHTYWSSRNQVYGQSQHYLVDLNKFDQNSDVYRSFLKCRVLECEGRLTKEKKAEWIKFANEAKNE